MTLNNQLAADESADLLKTVVDQAGQLAAIDILVRALIASHPEPDQLKLAVEVLATHFETQVRDHAFETNRSPKLVGAMEANVRKHVDRWLDILQSASGPK